MAKLLVVDDEKNLRLVVQKELTRQGHEVEVATNGEEAWALLDERDFDVLLSDIDMPRLDGMALLRRLREKLQNPPEVIMLTGQATVETAIEAMKLGAYDYLTKPYRITELSALVTQATEKQKLKIDNQRLKAQVQRNNQNMPEIIAESPQMKEILRFVQRVAPSNTSVLVTGESGTGKELIAQAIHRLSPRSDSTFIDLNCAALQDSLLESELFGHEAGAFSGAKVRKLGLFEIADGGTLFLDEVMEMPPQLQSKLLRALETRTFFRVGGVKKVEVDVRLVAATNRNPKQAIGEGIFRSDLLYRINSFEIHIPPLRERREDIEPIARHLLQKIAGANAPQLTDQAIQSLENYSWTGNVRQLRNCLERAILLADNGKITNKELSPEVVFNTNEPSVSVSYNTPQENGTSNFQNASAPSNLKDVEKQQIIGALEKTGWHRGKTAELLGISPSTLYRRLREYNMATR
ncbi:MAG: sigma-54 dependent transcriptional regulator [Acidobacteriota bacterium]|jgi:DNA-binding NtrC family response regulator|nr:sigma-54 dependent transcriptional regulator [Acidobacteriota bacterium]